MRRPGVAEGRDQGKAQRQPLHSEPRSRAPAATPAPRSRYRLVTWMCRVKSRKGCPHRSDPARLHVEFAIDKTALMHTHPTSSLRFIEEIDKRTQKRISRKPSWNAERKSSCQERGGGMGREHDVKWARGDATQDAHSVVPKIPIRIPPH